MDFTKYYLSTGQIICTGHISEGPLEGQITGPDMGVVEGECSMATSYIGVPGTEVLPRPAMTAVANKLVIRPDGTDLFILSGLPVPCTVTVEHVGTFDVDDGEFGFPTTVPGAYKVTASSFPFLDQSWGVIAS